MGYYDREREGNFKKKGRNRSTWLFSTIFGVLVGALIVVFVAPTITGVKDETNQGQVQEEDSSAANQTNELQQTVKVNVVSEVTNAVDKALGAVVGIINIQQTGFWSDNEQSGTGSGVIYKREDGYAYIVTNHHVVEGATQIEVNLENDIRVPGEILGSDVFTDLAVVRIEDKHVNKVAEFGDSDSLKIGEPVIAIGNPLGLTFSGSVTQGIISGLNRTIELDLNNDGRPDWQSEVIQTDAAINPGNSGGALVNIQGQVIGINSMKIARSEVEGIGLAIPIGQVIPVIEDLEQYGEVHRPYMGIGLRSLNEVSSYHWQETLKLPLDIQEGVFVVNVVPGSPAAKAGLQELDVIVALDGEPIVDAVSLRRHLYREKRIGDEMEVTYYRNGEQQTTTMELTGEGNY